MKCSNCGEELSPRAPYCGLCGTYAPGYESWGDQEVSGGQQNHFSANHSRAEYIDDYRSANGWDESRDLAIPDETAHAHRPPPPRHSEQYDEPRAQDAYGNAVDALIGNGINDDMRFAQERRYGTFYAALLGNNADDYEERFRDESIFNVYAFFFGLDWYAYRGMLGLAMRLSLLQYIPIIGPLILLYYRCTGDKQYRKHIETHAQALAQFEEGSHEWMEYVNTHGGTSIGAVVILWLFQIGVAVAVKLTAGLFMN